MKRIFGIIDRVAERKKKIENRLGESGPICALRYGAQARARLRSTMLAQQIDEKAIFNIARRIDSREARADYLQQSCGADTGALKRLVELLQVNEKEQSF